MWNGWPLERILLLFVGLAFFMLFVQVTLFHWRQNFRHWSMWLPVLGTPVIGLAALVLAFYNLPWIRLAFAILLWIGLAEGIYGVYKHTAGVGQRVGGYSQSQNFLLGPPIMLPMMMSAMSALGLVILYWG